ncbi:hypothetical protein F8388_024100 [Cannabis sativa]|uniref:CCHC-type domain-containing protein n=1 Tax=Cannabis sativa TaxID=3483 RepID=A0A7J6FXF7_CANSA|nr:hypothetical protein F8388_024100 [Cannabis sativa]KAF4383446.1 hypothetical protein G4B88_024020 [Cannabis sativa]
MEPVIATKPLLKGKRFTCLETTVSLAPCASSLKALSTLCLYGKLVAPMFVDEGVLADFVVKHWKKKVTVMALAENAKTSNCYEFGFDAAEDRDWVLQNGPWCFRGYNLVLKAWAPRTTEPVVFHHLRIWMQIHNLLQEYFSTENGNLLGKLAGKVVKVDLEDEKPALWGYFLRVLVDIEFEKPLVSGCFFDLSSGVKLWLQFKYENIGIFCYKCGVLGHQRKGCKLSSPVMIENSDDISFPMFGPWLSPFSVYGDVFSAPKPSGAPGWLAMMMVRGGQTRTQGMKARVPHPVRAVDGIGGDRLQPPGFSKMRRSRISIKTTTRPVEAAGSEDAEQAVGLPRPPSTVPAQTVAIYGNKGDDGQVFGEKGTATNLVMAIEGRHASGVRMNLNLEKEAIKEVGVGPSDGGPSSFGGPVVGSNKIMGPLGLFGFQSEKDKNGGGPLQANKDLFLNGFGDKAQSTNSLGQREPTGTDGNELMKEDGLGVVRDGDEQSALAHFFEAQEQLLYDLKHFGKLDLYEIKNIGGDIAVLTTSETNGRTTPFKKRKFEGSTSLCSRPHKLHRKSPGVVRDFPWDPVRPDLESKAVEEGPSKESSKSLSYTDGVRGRKQRGEVVEHQRRETI